MIQYLINIFPNFMLVFLVTIHALNLKCRNSLLNTLTVKHITLIKKIFVLFSLLHYFHLLKLSKISLKLSVSGKKN